MSKKHFVALASKIQKIANHSQRKAAAIAVASACKQFNPAFDAGRFYVACEVEV